MKGKQQTLKRPKNTEVMLNGVGVKVLVRRSGIGAQKRIRAIAVLLRNTTWKCGRMERLAVNYLRRQLQRCGHAQIPVRDMLQYFKLSGKQRSEFLEAIKRLERRHIIKIIAKI